jgi:uncharacterized protein YkwD
VGNRVRPSRAALLLLVALAGALPAVPVPASAQSGPPSDEETAALTARMIRHVNRLRAQNGAAPLVEDRRLDAAARAHAEDMVRRDFFDHRSPDGRGMQDRAAAVNYPWRELAENLGAGLSSPEATADAWMTSPAHRTNMLSPDHLQIGVGYARAPETGKRPRFSHYWVILVGAPAR